MTMTVDRGAPAGHADPPTPARRLRDAFAAARLGFTWLGVRKTLTDQQRHEAAEGFGAEGQVLSAGKKLLDTRHPAYRAVTSVRSRAVAYWRGVSLPYPKPGIRLIRQDHVGPFDAAMRDLADELGEAVAGLDERYAELRVAARRRLGRLFDERDYPASLRGLFALQWDFPGVEPPNYLLRLNPALYEQEKARVLARSEEAARLAEEAFTAEFSKLVGHLVERLGGGGEGNGDGKTKVFRDTAVTRLTEFFGRFKDLSVRSDGQLDELVETARRAVAGVGPQDLRGGEGLRQQVRTQLSSVQAALDQMLVDQPRRRILRQDRAGRCRRDEAADQY
jgi:hypothetical protein